MLGLLAFSSLLSPCEGPRVIREDNAAEVLSDLYNPPGNSDTSGIGYPPGRRIFGAHLGGSRLRDGQLPYLGAPRPSCHTSKVSTGLGHPTVRRITQSDHSAQSLKTMLCPRGRGALCPYLSCPPPIRWGLRPVNTKFTPTIPTLRLKPDITSHTVFCIILI